MGGFSKEGESYGDPRNGAARVVDGRWLSNGRAATTAVVAADWRSMAAGSRREAAVAVTQLGRMEAVSTSAAVVVQQRKGKAGRGQRRLWKIAVGRRGGFELAREGGVCLIRPFAEDGRNGAPPGRLFAGPRRRPLPPRESRSGGAQPLSI